MPYTVELSGNITAQYFWTEILGLKNAVLGAVGSRLRWPLVSLSLWRAAFEVVLCTAALLRRVAL